MVLEFSNPIENKLKSRKGDIIGHNNAWTVDTGHFPYKPDPMPSFLKNPKFGPFLRASKVVYDLKGESSYG